MRLELAYPQSYVPWAVLALVPVACCFWSTVLGLPALLFLL